MDLIHNYGSTLLSRFAGALSNVAEGDGTALDNSVMIYTSDNGEAHHSSKRRWPLAVLGSAGGRIKADGRFRRYAPETRSLVDFYQTLSESLDVPVGDFAKGTRSPVAGPLEDLMA